MKAPHTCGNEIKHQWKATKNGQCWSWYLIVESHATRCLLIRAKKPVMHAYLGKHHLLITVRLGRKDECEYMQGTKNNSHSSLLYKRCPSFVLACLDFAYKSRRSTTTAFLFNAIFIHCAYPVFFLTKISTWHNLRDTFVHTQKSTFTPHLHILVSSGNHWLKHSMLI